MKKTIVVALVVSPAGDVQTLTYNSYSEFKANIGVYERVSGWRLIEAKEVDFFYDLDQKEEAEGEQPDVNLDRYFEGWTKK